MYYNEKYSTECNMKGWRVVPIISYIPSLGPHSAKSGKQSQRATSDSRNKYYINCLPPGSTPTLTQQSPAVGSENITATRVIFTTSGQVGLTAPVRLERRNTELKLEKEQIFELRARPTLIQNNCRNLSEVIGNFLVLARLAKVFIDWEEMSRVWLCPTCSLPSLPPSRHRRMSRQTTGFSPPLGLLVQGSCLKDHGSCSLFSENMRPVLQ